MSPTKYLVTADMSAWKSMFVPDEVLKALAEDGFVDPTPIQALSLPSAVRDRMDIVGAAQTVSDCTDVLVIHIVSQFKTVYQGVTLMRGHSTLGSHILENP